MLVPASKTENDALTGKFSVSLISIIVAASGRNLFFLAVRTWTLGPCDFVCGT